MLKRSKLALISYERHFEICFPNMKFQNGAHLKKGLFLTYFSHFFSYQGKLQKFLQYISTHIQTCILLTLLTFLPYQF